MLLVTTWGVVLCYKIGIKTNLPQYVIAPCDLLLRFCIYKPAMEELRFYNNNHNNRKRAEQEKPHLSGFVPTSHARRLMIDGCYVRERVEEG